MFGIVPVRDEYLPFQWYVLWSDSCNFRHMLYILGPRNIINVEIVRIEPKFVQIRLLEEMLYAKVFQRSESLPLQIIHKNS